MVDKIFNITPVESPNSFKDTEVGFDVGSIGGSGTFDAYADVNYKYKLSDNFLLSSRVTTLYLDPSASAIHPDMDRNPLLTKEQAPTAFAAFNRVQVGTKYSATSPYAEDTERKKMIELAFKMPMINTVLAERHWDLRQLQENWGEFLEAVAKAWLLAMGTSLDMVNNDEIVNNLTLALLNRFSGSNPGKPDVMKALTIEEAMPCVEYVSKAFKDIQDGSLATTKTALTEYLEKKKDEEAIYEKRYIELIAGLIDAVAHQGEGDFGFRYVDPFIGEPISNGATSYGLGAMVKGAYTFDPFDMHRKFIEVSGRIAAQQPGRFYPYKEKDDGKMFDRKTGVVNAEAAVEISPWKFFSFILKGGFSKGWDELKEASSKWVGAEVKWSPSESVTIVPGVIYGKNGEFVSLVYGADAMVKLREKSKSDHVDLRFHVAHIDREVGKIEQKIKQVKTEDGDTSSEEWGAEMLSRPEQGQLMTAPDQIKTMLGDKGWSATAEVKVKDPLDIYDPLFIKADLSIFRGGRKIISAAPDNVEWAFTVNAGVAIK